MGPTMSAKATAEVTASNPPAITKARDNLMTLDIIASPLPVSVSLLVANRTYFFYINRSQ
jgi:hypothetical protein